MNLRIWGAAIVTKTITRAMLAEAAARKTELNKADVTAVGEQMFALMSTALMAGENV
ncbi:MAG: nucleoid DNA-binding protein, partial [Devosia sp.]